MVSGLNRPIYTTAPPNDATRLFIVEQHTGTIKILDLDLNRIKETPFLTISGLSQGNEQGLLGLAFHPDYGSNGFFYVNLTTAVNGTTEIRRYKVSANDQDRADENSATLVLSINQPQRNHNGGWIGFGPDQFLYICTGDGGGRDDKGEGHTTETGNSQDITNNLLGKVLRIDVDTDAFPSDESKYYAIPNDNPFVDQPGDDEIWAYGLRNPWRASFDRQTGDFYIADVGQNNWEEINYQPANSDGGLNYGWRLREGSFATPTGDVGGPKPQGAIDPVFEYPQPNVIAPPAPLEGRAVVGGYVYRGPVAELQGKYLFADFVSHQIGSIQVDRDSGTLITESLLILTAEITPDIGTINDISSFGEDARGNVYIIDNRDGEIFKIISTNNVLLSITKGWNLVSAPSTTELTLGELFGDIVLGRIWRWEHTVYLEADKTSKLDAKTGYWFFSKTETTIPLE